MKDTAMIRALRKNLPEKPKKMLVPLDEIYYCAVICGNVEDGNITKDEAFDRIEPVLIEWFETFYARKQQNDEYWERREGGKDADK